MAKKKTEKKKGERPPPSCKAIIIAAKTIIEEGTGLISIIGVFDGFTFKEFPGKTREAELYLQLVDGVGEYEITVEVQDLQQNIVIARATGITVGFPERLQRRTLIIPMPLLTLQHPGAYDVVVFANGQEIDRQQFFVKMNAPEGD